MEQGIYADSATDGIYLQRNTDILQRSAWPKRFVLGHGYRA
jgi:hypothetical protein